MALCHIAFNGNNPTRPSQPYPSQGWGGTSQALPITRNQHQDHLDLNIFATMQTSPDYLGLAYGCLVAMGGIMGFVKASSVPSLVAGTVSGGLIALGAHRYQQKGKPDLIFGMSVMLSLLMGKRFLASRKMMPAGMTTVEF
ncbi:hypothetical protein PSTT_15279 [Puccinia striiformis]|uniref:Transmembrane protein 14C n=1 Tax=Puccinia striiformis TaxID=27350 RepID=A0A2S4UIQ6_9BASI|nr:hypothetical protein PSTT_15279 [Puccinia striiformis]